VSLVVQKLAKGPDIPIFFALHNSSYGDTSAFEMVDYVIVPTEICRRFYWDTIGLASIYLPQVVDSERVQLEREESLHPHPLPKGEGTNVPGTLRVPTTSGTRSVPDTQAASAATRYAIFVNPEPRKGIHFFARIAEVLSRKRPDIPLLIVEGAGKASFLPQLGIDPSRRRT